MTSVCVCQRRDSSYPGSPAEVIPEMLNAIFFLLFSETYFPINPSPLKTTKPIAFGKVD